MNLSDFNIACNQIAKVCSKTTYVLKYEKQFPPKQRKNFDQILRDLLDLLNQDKDYFALDQKREMWHIAHRIIQLDKLCGKMDKILRQIDGLSGRKYFSYKLRQEIVPVLAKRVQDLTTLIFSNYRMPFSTGVKRDHFSVEARRAVDLMDSADVQRMEIEYFHFLGNHLKREDLGNINPLSFSGSLEIYSVQSWFNVVKDFLKEGNLQDIEVGCALLAPMGKALSLASKLSYIFHSVEDHKLNFFPSLISYFQDVVNIKANAELLELSQQQELSIDFFNKYSLDNEFAIPLSALENEITWDIVQDIGCMLKGEMRLFLLGSRRHRVAIQVTCLEVPSSDQPSGNYKYEIFNTGDGTSFFHRTKLEGKEIFARPITYHNVPQHLLCYPFFSFLVNHALLGISMDSFYRWHDLSLLIEGVHKNLDCGAWHPIQNFGICSYTSLEVWIHSHLTPEQIKKIELIKTQISIQKQRKVVQLLEQDVQLEMQWKAAYTSQNVMNAKIISKADKLEESRTLLKLGEKRLACLTLSNEV